MNGYRLLPLLVFCDAVCYFKGWAFCSTISRVSDRDSNGSSIASLFTQLILFSRLIVRFIAAGTL